VTLRTRAIVAQRALTTIFFGASALYGVLNFSSFAYQQFIRPRFVPWLVWSVVSYGGLFMGVYSITLLSLLDDVQRRSTRRLALAYIVFWGLVAVGLLSYPVAVGLGPDNGSLVFAALALAAALWLAVIDHVACGRVVCPDDHPVPRASSDAPLFVAAMATATYVWMLYAGLAVVRQSISGSSPVVSWLGAGYSLGLHIVVFTATGWLFVAAATAARDRRRARVVEYGLALLILAGWMFGVLRGLVLPAVGVTGVSSWLVAAGFAIAMTASWSGIALRLAADDCTPGSAIELFVRPALPVRSARALIVWLLVLPGAAYVMLSLSERMDWAFLLQKAGVLTIWFLAWAAMITLARGARRPSFGVAIGCSLVILAGYGYVRRLERGAAEDARFAQEAALGRYAAVDASFRTIDDTVAARPPTPPAFYELLQANSNVRHAVPIAPRPIRLGPSISRARERPDVFLFVFDSLRPDYLRPYNPAVTFTPSLSALAADSLVFRNAFTRYGGTGLAVPSIWSGTLLPHRQYVLPFAPMNALLALLEGNSYRVMASLDSIMTQLMPRSPRMLELGADSQRSRDDACTVLSQIGGALDRSGTDAPVFAYSLPQNTHISYVLGQPIPTVPVPGFYAPLAARVRQIDGCMGMFIDHLKARGRYDNSVIIVTSDHGDALGEGGRWGHGSAGFPEVLRIPLIVHLPPRLAARWLADVDAVSFSTDIVPTLYRLLDQDVTLQGPFVGMPLVYAPGASPPRERRRGSFLLAGSYGPVYGLLQHNGGLLYVVDAMNARDYAFNLAGGAPHATPVPVTPGERVAYQRVIAEQIDQIGAFFGFDAQAPR
jgi:hypothetical protein